MITTKEYLELKVGDVVIDDDGDTCVVTCPATINFIEFEEWCEVNSIYNLTGVYGGTLEDCLDDWLFVELHDSDDERDLDTWGVLPEDIVRIVTQRHSFDHTNWFKIWGAPPCHP